MKRYKKLTDKQVAAIEAEVKMMLHSSRDTMRNQRKDDSTVVSFNCYDGSYGEAFGIMRGLVTLGYGYFGSDNQNAVNERRSDIPRHNCKWWLAELRAQVLKEENFHGNNECDYCLEHYGKDGAGRSKKTS